MSIPSPEGHVGKLFSVIWEDMRAQLQKGKIVFKVDFLFDPTGA